MAVKFDLSAIIDPRMWDEINLFAHTCTVQTPVGTPALWTNKAGLSNLPCQYIPATTATAPGQFQTAGMAQDRIVIRGAYPAIKAKMRLNLTLNGEVIAFTVNVANRTGAGNTYLQVSLFQG